MKNILFILITLVISQTACAEVSIAKYKGNRLAAVSYTFDDGLLEQYTELWPQMKKYHIKGSFCVNGNTINRAEETPDTVKPRMTWAMMREMSQQGQEITNHGWAHINVNKLEGEALRYEVQHNDSVIFDKIGIFPRTYFYPGNAKSPEKVAYCEQSRVGSRTFQVSVGSKRNTKWLNQWVDSLILKEEWGVGMTHGLSRGYDHFSDTKTLWNHFRYVSSKRDSIWIATFHDVSAYIKERDAVKLKVKEKKNYILVTPTLNLDKDLFSLPLTLVTDKEVSAATQDGNVLIVGQRRGKSYVEFNPHGGVVRIITKSNDNQNTPVPVILTAGQSNTDGRVLNEELPDYVIDNPYRHCYWSYGSGTHSGEGKFELFWPRIYNNNNPRRWTYDAITYFWLEQALGCDLYVIKESLGGTAIDPTAKSTQSMYWSADPAYLDTVPAADKGGKSLLKAFVDNIGACIDNKLSKLPQGYDIKALLWHQGESDRPGKASGRYYDNLKAVIQYVRNYLVDKTGEQRYAHLPVIIGSIPKAGRGYSKNVDAAQKRLCEEDSDIYLVDADDAPLQSDNIHFNAPAAEKLGIDMFKVISEELKTLE